MSKLENISALLVATNSVFTKEAAFTTKTTRAELIRMLQATDFAVSEALEVAENYVKVSDQLLEDKEKLSAEVQELNDSVGQLENKLEREASAVERLAESEHTLKEENENLQAKCSELEAKLVATNTSNQELQLKLVDANKFLKAGEASLLSLEYQVHKYKQQGFFDRLFGRTPE